MEREDFERFISKVDQNTGTDCWLWTAAVIPGRGYAKFWYQGKNHAAHRIAYEHYVGAIPPGMTVDHECHNVADDCLGGGDKCLHRRCVNPNHLIPRSLKDNLAASKHSTSTIASSKTHCPQGHEYAGENLLLITRGDGSIERRCKTCRKDIVQRAREKKMANKERNINVRIEDPMYVAVRQAALIRNTNMGEVVREALIQYLGLEKRMATKTH